MATISLDKGKIVGNEDISPSGEMIQNADFENLTLDAELIK